MGVETKYHSDISLQVLNMPYRQRFSRYIWWINQATFIEIVWLERSNDTLSVYLGESIIKNWSMDLTLKCRRKSMQNTRPSANSISELHKYDWLCLPNYLYSWSPILLIQAFIQSCTIKPWTSLQIKLLEEIQVLELQHRRWEGIDAFEAVDHGHSSLQGEGSYTIR